MIFLRNLKSNFLIKFNFLYLGGLFFFLLFIGSINYRARIAWGPSWMWTTEHLNGFYIAVAYLLLLLIAGVSYAYALWKTWKLTRSKTLLNKGRLFAFGWLLGAPALIVSTPMFWLSAMLFVTDPLFQR